MVFSTAGFAPVFPEKRLELKSLKGWTKAEEVRDWVWDRLFISSRFSGKSGAKRRNRGCTVGERTLS
jgi:hypothetical protein